MKRKIETQLVITILDIEPVPPADVTEEVYDRIFEFCEANQSDKEHRWYTVVHARYDGQPIDYSFKYRCEHYRSTITGPIEV